MSVMDALIRESKARKTYGGEQAAMIKDRHRLT